MNGLLRCLSGVNSNLAAASMQVAAKKQSPLSDMPPRAAAQNPQNASVFVASLTSSPSLPAWAALPSMAPRGREIANGLRYRCMKYTTVPCNLQPRQFQHPHTWRAPKASIQLIEALRPLHRAQVAGPLHSNLYCGPCRAILCCNGRMLNDEDARCADPIHTGAQARPAALLCGCFTVVVCIHAQRQGKFES